jgi:hypothetical protein
MTIEQYKTLLSLYKKKINGGLTEKEVSDAKLKAKMEFDKDFIENKPTRDIQEFINELNLL